MADRIAPRLLGFAFYWAWTLLCFQSTVAFLPGPGLEAVFQSHSEFFACSLVGTVIAHPLWAWAIHRFPSLRTRTPWACAVLQSASILFVGAFAGLLPVSGAGATATEALVVAAAAVSGIASAFMDVRWSQVYGMQRPDVSGRCITLSIALGIALYFALGLVGRLSPIACTVCLAALPPLCAWTLGLNARREAEEPTVPPAHNARQIAGILWRPVAGSLVFFFVYGCIESLVSMRADLNAVQAAALAVELVCMLVLFACLRRRSRLSVGGVYGVALVLVAAGFMVLPLAMRVGGGAAGGLFGATTLVNAGTALFDALLYCMIAHAAYDYRTPGGVVNGVVRGITVGASALGHFAGRWFGEGFWSGSADVVLFVLAVSYLLIVSASFFLARRRLVGLPAGDDAPEGMQVAEVLAPNPVSTGVRHVVGAATSEDPTARDWRTVVVDTGGRVLDGGTDSKGAPAPGTAPSPADAPSDAARLERLLDKRIEEIAFAKHLSRRETDVFALIARGRSLPYIAETLVLSENTVRSHTRRVYAKLGVHSKQELLDLVENGGTADGK